MSSPRSRATAYRKHTFAPLGWPDVAMRVGAVVLLIGAVLRSA